MEEERYAFLASSSVLVGESTDGNRALCTGDGMGVKNCLLALRIGRDAGHRQDKHNIFQAVNEGRRRCCFARWIFIYIYLYSLLQIIQSINLGRVEECDGLTCSDY